MKETESNERRLDQDFGPLEAHTLNGRVIVYCDNENYWAYQDNGEFACLSLPRRNR